MTPNERRWIVLRAIEDHAASFGYSLVPSVLILGQAELESGGFTSNLAVNANNVFGMRMPTVRDTTAIGSVTAEGGAAFAKYASLSDAVKDYFMRQRNFNIPNTADVEQYIAATVESGYATDPDYSDKWASVALALNDGGLGDPPPEVAYGPEPPPPAGSAQAASTNIGTLALFGLAVWALN